MGGKARPRRLDRPARADYELLRRVQEPVRPARSRHRGRRASRTSSRSSSNTATRSSSSRARRSSSTGASPSARRISSSARGYVVTVRHGASTSYAAVRAALRSPAPPRLRNGEDYILYAILDFIVDNYMPVRGDRSTTRSRRSRTGSSPSRSTSADIERLYMLRRDLLRLRNAAVPLVEVCRRLEHADAAADRRRPCSRCSAT